MRAIARVTVVLSLASCLAACAHISLSEVSQYAQTAEKAKAQFAAVSQDDYDSCVRKREFQRTAFFYAPPLLPPFAAQATKTAGSAQPAATPEPLSGDVTSDPACLEEYKFSQRWQQYNTVIIGYAQSLGAIANATAKPSGFSNVASAVTKLGGFNGNSSIATAAANVATSISNLVVQHDQEADLSRFVIENKTNMDSLLPVMQAAAIHYALGLCDELIAVNQYYRNHLYAEEIEYQRLSDVGGNQDGRSLVPFLEQVDRIPNPNQQPVDATHTRFTFCDNTQVTLSAPDKATQDELMNDVLQGGVASVAAPTATPIVYDQGADRQIQHWLEINPRTPATALPQAVPAKGNEFAPLPLPSGAPKPVPIATLGPGPQSVLLGFAAVLRFDMKHERDNWRSDQDNISGHLTAATAYIGSIGSIIEGHDKLVAHAENHSLSALASDMSAPISDLEKNIGAMETALKATPAPKKTK